MADIKIENVDYSGFDLFSDSENFLTDLYINDVVNVDGGLYLPVTVCTACCSGNSFCCEL